MYIDPTAGSLALQVLAAGALSAVAMFGRLREVLRNFFRLARCRADGRTSARRVLPRSQRIRLYQGRNALPSGQSRLPGQRFQAFLDSGLYAELVGRPAAGPASGGLAVSRRLGEAVAVLEPERVDFVSYPYEWSFGQLRDAALLTLELQERALARGPHPARRQRVQRPVRRRAPALHRHPVVRAPRGRRTVGGVSAVLRALPGAPGADEQGRRRGRRRCCAPTWRASPSISAAGCCPGAPGSAPGLLFHVHLHALAQRRYADRGAGNATTRRRPPGAG